MFDERSHESVFCVLFLYQVPLVVTLKIKEVKYGQSHGNTVSLPPTHLYDLKVSILITEILS